MYAVRAIVMYLKVMGFLIFKCNERGKGKECLCK